MTDAILYHYTCSHGHQEIVDRLVPHLGLVWLTDLEIPIRYALGLTSTMLACDRTKYRYRVTDTSDCVHWVKWPWRQSNSELELAPGVLPMHWWIAERPVPVVYDPIGGAA